MNIAIIPARSGSKRIPKKNIKEFLGKPMLAYAIQASKQANIFDIIMVSTDSEDIASIAKQYGADVPFLRSKENSSDFATTFDVLQEVIQNYQEQGIDFSTICCIYPCVPFLTGNTLKNAFSYLKEYESVIPVCKYPVPIEWAMEIKNNILVPHNKESLKIRSQDLIPKYFDAGMFYFSRPHSLLENKGFMSKNTYAFVLPEQEVQDIDTLEDWKNAEIKYKVMQHEYRS